MRRRQRRSSLLATTCTPDTRLSNDPMKFNLCSIDSLLHLACGGIPVPLGSALHTRLRYFDPQHGHPGLRTDVAALVDRLGNSQLIAAKHYLQVTDEHFAKATHNQTHSGAEIGETEGKAVIRPLRENEKGPEFPGLSAACRLLHSLPVPPVGLEPTT